MRTLASLGLVAVSLVSLVSGCGTAEESVGEAKSSLTIEMPTFKIPTGESFMCFYSDVVTDEDLNVYKANGVQVKGGHHLTLYYVDNKREPGMEACSGTKEMVDWHFVVGAGGEGNANDYLQLADGLAIRVPKGKQLMVQAHYINATGAEADAKDSLEVFLKKDEEVEQYASDFVINNDVFELEPHADLTTTMECEVPQDLNLTMMLGHMHEQGAHFKLEEIDELGEVKKVHYEEQWQPSYASHPPLHNFTIDEPLVLKKGTRLRQTCTWKNATDELMLFPTEMCITFGYYFPGEERVMCERAEVATP